MIFIKRSKIHHVCVPSGSSQENYIKHMVQDAADMGYRCVFFKSPNKEYIKEWTALTTN